MDRMLILTAILLTVSPTGQAAQLSSAEDHLALRGRVVDARTGAPIPLAAVSVEGTRLGSQTDADGRFMIVNVDPADSLELRVAHMCFFAVVVEIGEPAGFEVNIGLPYRPLPPSRGMPIVGRCTQFEAR